jgi:uncharacterized protein YcfJ
MDKLTIQGIAAGVVLAATFGLMAGCNSADNKQGVDPAVQAATAQQAEADAAATVSAAEAAAPAVAPTVDDAATPTPEPAATVMTAPTKTVVTPAPVAAKSRYAEVLSTTPVNTSEKVAREVCHDEQVTRQKPVKDEKRVAGAVVGAVLGGVLGNQVGGGDGKKIATVAGAAAGGYAGSKTQKAIQENNTETVTERKCETVYDTKQTAAGYDVKYRLDGAVGTARMDSAPTVGSLLPVKNGKIVGAN